MFKYTLRSLLTTLAVVLSVVFTAGLSFISERISADHFKRRIGQQLANRSAELADKLDRALHERYQDIQFNAQALSALDPLKNPAATRELLDKLKAMYEGYAWVGFAAPNGTVLAASDGLLEGSDVSQRPWFNQAFTSAFVGDFHRALLLEKKLNADGAEPLRFLDISVPIVGRDGSFRGVLGAHIDWRWVKKIRITLPNTKRSEALLISADSTVLLGPPDLQDQQLTIDSIRLAKASEPGFRIERWPDGKTYLTGYSKTKGHGAYPGLGWIMLERQEINDAFAPVHVLSRQLMLWGAAIAGLFALLGWLVAARIARPLNTITRAAESLQRGERAEIPKIKSYREAAILAHALRRLIRDLTRREAELAHQATHHSLTQLPNRALVKAVLDQTIARLAGSDGQIAVLALNLDRFKMVNDTHGYDAGDAVLRATAERLSACIGNAGTLGHVGEDKFVILLEDHDSSLLQTSRLASLAREAIAMPFAIKNAEFFLTTSIGISLFPKDGQDAETLLGYSELALYQAKQQGGDRIEFYEARMNATVLARLDLERELRQALERQQLELHYQPQLSLTTGKIVGVEALVRWRHPERGLIPPAQFIPVAEASGLIIPIGDWVLSQACAQSQAWRQQGLPPIRMGVNVSVQQFNAGNLVERVTEALQNSGLEAGALQLEITESLLMQEVEQSITTMRQLTGLGVHLAIDDFGTGYSSLAYLKQFPISELKIDQAFIRESTSLSNDTAIVRAIIGLGHTLQLRVIAEGVETAEQFSFLQQAGCDEIQGYYFSRPLPADQIAGLLDGER